MKQCRCIVIHHCFKLLLTWLRQHEAEGRAVLRLGFIKQSKEKHIHTNVEERNTHNWFKKQFLYQFVFVATKDLGTMVPLVSYCCPVVAAVAAGLTAWNRLSTALSCLILSHFKDDFKMSFSKTFHCSAILSYGLSAAVNISRVFRENILCCLAGGLVDGRCW